MNFGKGPHHAYANCKYAYQKCPIYYYIYGRSNETNEGSECSQNGKYIDKVPRDLRHILNFPSQVYLALLAKYKSSKHSVRYFFYLTGR